MLNASLLLFLIILFFINLGSALALKEIFKEDGNVLWLDNKLVRILLLIPPVGIAPLLAIIVIYVIDVIVSSLVNIVKNYIND